jgi:UDP-N-acetylmuramate dehydrogenase
VALDVAAGEPWDAVVERCVAEALAGIECLSGIPGLVGATPIQNVGAYGQEVGDVLESVRVLDRRSGAITTLARADCAFAYRDSRFKREPHWVVLAVRLNLRRQTSSLPLRYAELCRTLGIVEGETAPLPRVRATVLALRRAKAMVIDPGEPDSKSVGSFFMNPIITAKQLTELEQLTPSPPPRHPHGDGFKIPAAWLVERAGFKGKKRGPVGVSQKHALALVHKGGGTTAQLIALANEVRDGVLTRFGVRLEPEPVLVGVALS